MVENVNKMCIFCVGLVMIGAGKPKKASSSWTQMMKPAWEKSHTHMKFPSKN